MDTIIGRTAAVRLTVIRGCQNDAEMGHGRKTTLTMPSSFFWKWS
jgi:hypothetical protein